MDSFIGQIVMFGGNFPPRNWAFCEGQLLPIASYNALFSILGTIYGGDGRTTFALPDLRGRLPMHWGQGPGLTSRQIGQKGGEESVTLNVNQMPAHNHEVRCQDAQGTLGTPVDNYLAADRAGADDVYSPTQDAIMNSGVIAPTGGGQAHDNMSPFLAVSFIIALEGVYPSRN